MSILDDISSAAYDFMAGRVGDGFLPVAKNFNIAAIRNSRFDVYSYVTRVAVVNKNENGDRDTLVHRDAFHHSTTTSRHVRCFVSAVLTGTRFTRRATKLAMMKLLTIMGNSLSM